MVKQTLLIDGIHKHLENKLAIDCIIIGGGIIGMMTARELSKAGLKVQILEKGQIGQEASWAGGGILSPLYPWDTPQEIWPMIVESQREYPEICRDLEEETGIDPQWLQSGLINFDQIDGDKLKDWAEKTGLEYSKLDTKQIAEIEPAFNQVHESSIWLPTVAQVRNPRILKALKRSLLDSGVKIQEGIEVSAINQVKGKVESVEATEGRIPCKFVVVAAGAWSGLFFEDRSTIEPVRGQMLLIDSPEGFLNRIVLKDGIYLIPRKSGQILIGSTVEYVGFDKGITQEAAEKLKTAAVKMLPPIREYNIVQHWAGLRPATSGGIPVIQEDQRIQGLFFNTGHFRNGVVLAPASSRKIFSLILNHL